MAIEKGLRKFKNDNQNYRNLSPTDLDWKTKNKRLENNNIREIMVLLYLSDCGSRNAFRVLYWTLFIHYFIARKIVEIRTETVTKDITEKPLYLQVMGQQPVLFLFIRISQ